MDLQNCKKFLNNQFNLTIERMFYIMIEKVIWDDERDIVRVL